MLATRRNKPEREGERARRRLEGRGRRGRVGPGRGRGADGRVATPRTRSASTRCGGSAPSGSTRTAGRTTTSRSSPRRSGSPSCCRKDLTVGSTTFTDTDVVRGGRPAARRGLPRSTTIERITTLVLADPTRCWRCATDDGRQRYTSRELHDVEERFVDVVTRRADRAARSTRRVVAAAIDERPTLGRRPGRGGDAARRASASR